MTSYTCEKCKHVFGSKTDYTRHLEKKIPCNNKPVSEVIQELKEEVVLHIKFDMYLIPILHNIVLAFSTHFTGSFGGSFRAIG